MGRVYELALLHGLSELGAGVANTLQDLLNELHETIVVDGLRKLDNSEVALALFGFAACFALLVDGAHTHAQVVETSARGVPMAVEFGVGKFNNCPPVLGYTTHLQSPPYSAE